MREPVVAIRRSKDQQQQVCGGGVVMGRLILHTQCIASQTPCRPPRIRPRRRTPPPRPVRLLPALKLRCTPNALQAAKDKTEKEHAASEANLSALKTQVGGRWPVGQSRPHDWVDHPSRVPRSCCGRPVQVCLS